MSLAEPGRSPVRPGLGLLPQSPPSEPVSAMRERLGLERLVCLGLNEGQFGPFPAARAALQGLLPTLNRYPTRGSTELAEVLAVRLGVDLAELVVTAGADAAIGYVCQATIDPGDEIVSAWPSFPSFVRDAQKCGGVPVRVPVRNDRIDVTAMLGAVTARTKLVFVATPNNPTGLTLDREELDRLLDGLPEHALLVVDEAYLDFMEPATRLDTIEHALRRGAPVLVIRTFSKLYGLAGLRVGFAAGPAAVIAAMRQVQRGYDVSAPAQIAALASLDDGDEVVRRRGLTRVALTQLTDVLTGSGLPPVSGAAGNFVFVEVGPKAEELAAALLGAGVIVQPTAPFGAPQGVRITAGSPDEIAFFAQAFAAVRRGSAG